LLEFAESPIDGLPQEMEWINEATVFALTARGTIYRSVDNGKTWQNQMPYFPVPTSTMSKSIRTMRVAAPESGAEKVFFLGNGNAVWVTSDGGATYEYRKFSVSDPSVDTASYPLLDILPHPLEADWALAIDSQNIPNVYYTKDLGNTWTLLSSFVSQYFWPDLSSLESPNPPPVSGAYILKYQVNKDTDTDMLKVDGLSQLIGYNSTFTKPQILASNISQLSVFANQIAIVNHEAGKISSKPTLRLSSDGGFHWKTATFTDYLNITTKIVKIIEISEYKIFISVADQNQQQWSHMYSANLKDMIFSLSLKYVAQPPYEGSLMKGIPYMTGTYISNYYAIEGKDLSTTDLESSLRSVITYTQGSRWLPLDSSCFASCPTGCSLHLGVLNSEEFLAPETDVGLIIATGNEGCNNTLQKTLFLSRDGGWTWRQLSHQRQIFDVADHGAFLVFAPSRTSVDSFTYSIDYGVTTTSCEFTTSGQYQTHSFYSATDSTSSSFILSASNSSMNMLFYINFSNYFSRDCVGANRPGAASSDFETWSPSDDLNKQCLNGATTKFSRRKPTAQCFNPQEFEPIISVTPCDCDTHDYECGPCYERNGDECVLMSTPCAFSDIYEQPKDCEDTWTQPSPYQVIQGNECLGFPYADTKIPCSSDSGSDSGLSTTGLVVVICITIFITGFLFMFAFYFWRRNFLERHYKHKKLDASSSAAVLDDMESTSL